MARGSAPVAPLEGYDAARIGQFRADLRRAMLDVAARYGLKLNFKGFACYKHGLAVDQFFHYANYKEEAR